MQLLHRPTASRPPLWPLWPLPSEVDPRSWRSNPRQAQQFNKWDDSLLAMVNLGFIGDGVELDLTAENFFQFSFWQAQSGIASPHWSCPRYTQRARARLVRRKGRYSSLWCCISYMRSCPSYFS